jgi:hypothetical protein
MADSPIYPRSLAIGLALSAPTLTDPGTEVAAPGYARQVVAFALSNSQPGALTNAAVAQWPRATSLWGTIGWLTAWDLDGVYAGYGGLVSVSNGVMTPASVAIGQGYAARFAIGGLTLTDRNGPSLYGAGLYGAGPYSAPAPPPPRPYSRAPYSAGPYSRGAHVLKIVGVMGTAFVDADQCCPDAATWAPDAPCSAGAWTPAACSAAAWTLEALP